MYSLSAFLVIITVLQHVSLCDQYVFGGNLELSQTWDDAESLCQEQFNTHLASIHSDADNAEVQALCTSNTGSYSDGVCYIGLKDDGYHEFEWVDGTALDYTNWTPSAPNYNGECVWITKSVGKWNDVPCAGGKASKFICNAPPDSSYLCVSGLSGGYKVLNGEYTAIRSSSYMENNAANPGSDTISTQNPGFENLYELTTCDGETYYVGVSPFECSAWYQEVPEYYPTQQSVRSVTPIMSCNYFIPGCGGIVYGDWGSEGTGDIEMSWGRCDN